MQRRFLPFALVLGLSACAASSVPWQNPSVPESEWARDWQSCRRWAEAQIGYREDEGSSQFRDFDRARAKRQANSLAAGCMTDRGYLPARSKK